MFFIIICKDYAKIVQTSAMKACFQIAECSLSYAKINKKNIVATFCLCFITPYSG